MLKEMHNSYLKGLQKIYGDDADKMEILKTLVVMAPCLGMIGETYLYKPLAIVTGDRCQAEQIVKDLEGYGSQFMPLGVAGKQLKAAICNTCESDTFGFFYEKGTNADKNFNLSLGLSGMKQENGRNNLVLIFFYNVVPDQMKESLIGRVYINVCENGFTIPEQNNEFTRQLIHFICRNAPSINREARRIEANDEFKSQLETNPELLPLLLAGHVLQMIYESANYISEELQSHQLRISNALRKLANDWIFPVGVDEMELVFTKSFLDSADYVPGIINADAAETNHLDEYPIYNEEFYYLPKYYWEKICAPLLQIYSMNAIIGKLMEADLLVGEGSGRTYNSVKATVLTIYGRVLTRRRYRLRRSRIDRIGEMSWADLIEQNGGGVHDD